jgi:hypothetical protein
MSTIRRIFLRRPVAPPAPAPITEEPPLSTLQRRGLALVALREHGLSCQQIADLGVADFDPEACRLGGQVIRSETALLIESYQDELPTAEPEEPLFRTADGRRMSVRMVQQAYSERG